MKRWIPALLGFAICSLLLGGCSTANNTSTTNATNTSTTKTTNTSTTNTSATTTAANGDKVGVPECDDYLAKYESCLQGKVPEAARASLASSLTTTRKAWRDAAATPQGRAGLAQACTAAKDAAKQTMAAYKCDW